MKLKTLLYSEIEVKEPILIDLMNSKPLQRLKKIHSAGYNFVAGNEKDASRFEHSIGVMTLLRKYGAPLDEQISGLLHDISHTAFSHVSTYVLQDGFEGDEFHEKVKSEFIGKTEIPEIFNKYGLDLKYILEEKNFSLLENDLPDICADRIDYSLRDGLIFQFISKDDLRLIFEGLKVSEGSFIFENITSARKFSNNFFVLNDSLYGSAFNAYFNHKFGDLLKYAMEEGIISQDAWFEDDYFILDQLNASTDKRIRDTLNSFKGQLIVFEDNKDPQFTFNKKLRIVDPKILVQDEIRRLSEVDDNYREKIDRYQKEHLSNKLNISTYLRNI